MKRVGSGNPPPYCDKIPTKSRCGFGLKIPSRSVIHSTLFSCKEFGESVDSGEFDDFGEPGESDDSVDSGESGDFGDSGDQQHHQDRRISRIGASAGLAHQQDP